MYSPRHVSGIQYYTIPMSLILSRQNKKAANNGASTIVSEITRQLPRILQTVLRRAPQSPAWPTGNPPLPERKSGGGGGSRRPRKGNGNKGRNRTIPVIRVQQNLNPGTRLVLHGCFDVNNTSAFNAGGKLFVGYGSSGSATTLFGNAFIGKQYQLLTVYDRMTIHEVTIEWTPVLKRDAGGVMAMGVTSSTNNTLTVPTAVSGVQADSDEFVVGGIHDNTTITYRPNREMGACRNNDATADSVQMYAGKFCYYVSNDQALGVKVGIIQVRCVVSLSD
jgi:hypothetical protein